MFTKRCALFGHCLCGLYSRSIIQMALDFLPDSSTYTSLEMGKFAQVVMVRRVDNVIDNFLNEVRKSTKFIKYLSSNYLFVICAKKVCPCILLQCFGTLGLLGNFLFLMVVLGRHLLEGFRSIILSHILLYIVLY